MTDQPRDWDKELAAIDAQIARMPAPPAQPATPARAAPAGGTPASPPPALPAGRGARQFVGAWVRALIGAVLAVAVWSWPYAHPCGWALYGYSGAIAMVVVAGAWGMAASWRRRVGLAHLVSLGVFLAGLILAAATVLPRTGYARVPATWMCP
jgi:hypothetical protein